MSAFLDLALSASLPLLTLAHLFIAPFTKVEESFNIQAIHDIQSFGFPGFLADQNIVARYDHVEFPGSVPRTFVGALFLAYASSPIKTWLSDPLQAQMLARGILGLLNAFALVSLRRTLYRHYGQSTANWYTLLQASQFHVIFYASRTLPNSYAFVLTTLALRSYIIAADAPTAFPTAKRQHFVSLFLLTLAGVVFRAEIAVLVFTQTAYLLAMSQGKLITTIVSAGLAGLAVGLALTVTFDSVLWQYFPTWPEWTSFHYNTVLGKASDWGVSPWHWYFTAALPKLLQPSFPLVIISLLRSLTRHRAIPLIIPSLAFVMLYSLLPHKEWRFIIYTVPALTSAAALSASRIWDRRAKGLLYRLASLTLVAAVALNLAVSTTSLFISSLNYPGGEAVLRLKDIVAASTEMDNPTAALNIFADNLTCQTGLTRFLSASAGEASRTREKVTQGGNAATSPRLVFDKTENTTALLDPFFWERFDYALAEKPERCIGAWEVVDTVRSFAGVKVLKPGSEIEAAAEGYASLPFGRVLATVEDAARKVTGGWWVRIRMEPRISILRKQREIGGHAPVMEV